MGNQHAHGTSKSGESTPKSQDGQNGSKKSVSRRASGSDVEHEKDPNRRPSIQLLPLEKLAKILTDRSNRQEGVNGITQNVFISCLFSRYQTLGEKLYTYFLINAKAKNTYISTSAFKQQCEKYLGILDDELIRTTFVKMWSSNDDTMTPESLKSLLMCAYHISMDHYSEGPQMCLGINKTLTAVVDSCFHNKNKLSTSFVTHWLQTNAPRLLLPLHRYAVHSLATSWRTLEQDEPTFATGLELATPVLEQPSPFSKTPHPHLLTMSMSWLLTGALPPLYSRPQKAHSPSSSGTGLASMAFLSKLVCAIPSHWTLLYDSDEMGLGANRFLHHVLNYRGPTLVIIKVEQDQKFCMASPCEWRESHQYWGGEECAVFQLFPKFQVLERGSKMLYLNLSVRGYPQGLRAGTDPRAPIISVDAGFEKVQYQKIPYHIKTIEVWGCGDQVLREKQIEVKKWQVKEAEKQRTMKLSASDWLDHPDRYLLELAGRQVYHQNQN